MFLHNTIQKHHKTEKNSNFPDFTVIIFYFVTKKNRKVLLENP